MLRQTERSAVRVMAKRGQSIRQIAAVLGRSPTTMARVLKEPVDQPPAKRRRRSKADAHRPQVEQGIGGGLSKVRIREKARSDPAQPYRGGRTVFDDPVRRVRRELAQQRAVAAVPVRFGGLPAEYLRVDGGEVRRFPFTRQIPRTRYFLARRLKHSRFSWACFTGDMRQETPFRGLAACFVALGWVPWVPWVPAFDNVKTGTGGRDATARPVWTPALLHPAGEFGFHPQACDPGAGNQKGSVESLVKWVEGNFLLGRAFADAADLAAQAGAWGDRVNARPSGATGDAPAARLAAEAVRGGRLPLTAHDLGLLENGVASREALVAVAGNRYSVPVAHLGTPVTVRPHRERVRIWRDAACPADRPRAADGARQRVIDPAHFAPLFPAKPRAQVMLYRGVLLGLGGRAPAFLGELSRRQRARLRGELLAVYALYEGEGAAALLAAIAQADAAGTYNADALARLLTEGPPLATAPSLSLPGVPRQSEVDRAPSAYEAWVEVHEALPEVLR